MHSGSKLVGNESGGALEASIASATQGLLGFRQPDGHWVFELEADCTIPSEYVLLRHYLGEPVDAALEAKNSKLSAPGRAPMAAGRWCMTAISK